MRPKILATSTWSVVCTNPLAQMLLASVLAGGAFALAGCAADSSSGQTASGAASEPVTTTRSALTQPNSYTWSQGGAHPVVRLESQSDSFCYLTGMSGRFRGLGESVHVTSDPDGSGYWALTGSSGQVGVSATAMCVPWANFNHPAWNVGFDQYVHNDQHCAMNPEGDIFITDPFGTPCAVAQLQGPKSFCSLSGVAGRLMFGGNLALGGGPKDCNNSPSTTGDLALVQWSPPGGYLAFETGVSNAYVQTTSPYPCNVDGWQPTLSDWATCMSFNNSPALNVSQYYTVTNGGSVDMGAMSDEFCALAGVTGRFDGSGESVSIAGGALGSGHYGDWVLSASDNKVGATALCVYYPSSNDRTFGVFRPSRSEWYIAHNNHSTLISDNVSAGGGGRPGDLPVAGDWDGDGRSGVGFFREGTGEWFFSNSENPVAITIGPTQSWGAPGDLPIAGDWDGNGTITIGRFRPSSGEWFFSNSITNPQTDIHSPPQWGQPGDMPVAGDWDGDGRYGVGVLRPSKGEWYFSNSLSPATTAIGPNLRMPPPPWGQDGDLPIAGDWFGDRKPTIGVFRPSSGEWFFSNELAVPQTDIYLPGPWGVPGDYPMAAASSRVGWVSRWQL